MTTTITSIGSNQNINSQTPSTCTSSGTDEWVVVFASTPSASVVIGDLYVAEDEQTTFNVYYYLVTAISGTSYTLKYVKCDDNSMMGCSSTSPCDVYGWDFGPAEGTFKRAFSTITFFEEMVDDASPLYWGTTDDVVGECHGDGDFTDPSVSFTQKRSLSSVKLTAYSADRHTGIASGTGGGKVLLRPTTGSTHDLGIFRVGIDSLTIEWIEIDMSELDATATNKAVVLNGTNDDFILRNMLIHDKGGDPGGSGPHIIHTIAAGASTDTLTIQNNIIYDIVETDNDSAVALNLNQWAGISNVYNNTIYKLTCNGSSKTSTGIIFGNPSTAVANIKNNIISLLGGNGSKRAYWKNGSGSTANTANNLSDDTADTTYDAEDMGQALDDTSALIGKTLAQIAFVSTTSGAVGAFHLGADSVAREAGVDLGTTNEVNIDIDGVDRDATGVTWDIGADQASGGASTSGKAFLIFLDI